MSAWLMYDELVQKRACKPQLRLFEKRFGDGVKVTEELAVEVSSAFDFGWAIDELLSHRPVDPRWEDPWVEVDRETDALAHEHVYRDETTPCPACVEDRKIMARVFARRFIAERAAEADAARRAAAADGKIELTLEELEALRLAAAGVLWMSSETRAVHRLFAGHLREPSAGTRRGIESLASRGLVDVDQTDSYWEDGVTYYRLVNPEIG